MSTVATLDERHVTSPVVTPIGTPHRNVRVGAAWKPFGENVGERNRSSWINEFIEWVNLDPALWHNSRRIARLRGETLEGVILSALRRYVSRNRHLLNEAEDE